MGDSTEMTIEFLRARLLSERSVSQTARQRAEQLAKRVLELEEQLRIVSIQRKKAEKAAAGVLSILEAQGISDLSDATDYSSDQEESSGKGGNDNQKEYESSTASRMERSEVDDGMSGTEPEVSPADGGSLSWKSQSNTPASHDKHKAKQIRQRQRRRSFMSILQSSPKHHLGKSCRKIKSRDKGSAADCETQNPIILDGRGKEELTCSANCDDQPKVFMQASRSMMEEAAAGISNYVGDDNNRTDGHSYGKENGRDEDMESAIAQQAKLIGQFQAEENAQREWEEKYNENKAYSEPENLQPRITENNIQYKKEVTEVADRIPEFEERAKLRALPISSTYAPVFPSSSETHNRSKDTSNVAISNGFITSNQDPPTKTHSNAAVNGSKNISHDFAFSSPENYATIKNRKQSEITLQDGSSNYQSTNSSVHQAPIGSSGKPYTVLEALQRAKLSLSQELSKLPSQNQGTLAIRAQLPNFQTIGLDIPPIGSASLFRLPTDPFPTSLFSEPTLFVPGLSFPASPDVGYATSSYGLRNPTNTAFEEARSRSLPRKEYPDNHILSNVPYPSMYPRAYSDLSSVQRVPSLREYSKSYSDARNRVFPRDATYPLYRGDHTS